MRTGISRLIAAFTGFPFSSGGASQRPDWFSTHPSIVAIPESGRGVSETPRRLHMASRPAQPPSPSPGRQPSYSGRSGALAHGSPVWRALEPVSGRVQGLPKNRIGAAGVIRDGSLEARSNAHQASATNAERRRLHSLAAGSPHGGKAAIQGDPPCPPFRATPTCTAPTTGVSGCVNRRSSRASMSSGAAGG